MFSTPSKRARVAVDGDDANFSNIDSQVRLDPIRVVFAIVLLNFVLTVMDFPLRPIQFGLSSTSLEMPGMDEYLQMQDSIACRVRAKRGCATHPRSIAERVSYLQY
jgi:hypothetical protein